MTRDQAKAFIKAVLYTENMDGNDMKRKPVKESFVVLYVEDKDGNSEIIYLRR